MRPVPRLMPALLTPFTAGGDLDLAAHAANVSFLSDNGLEGLLIAGSTGEGPYLEQGERASLIAAAREAADTYLLCGINGETLRSARSQIHEAADAGADAVLVITPTTLARNRHGLVEGFYLDVADGSPVPVFLYTVPPVTGYELPADVVARLSGHENIVGMKDSGGDTARLDQLTDAIRAGFMVFIGASRAVKDGLERGAYGAITASANYAYAELLRLVDTARKDDAAAAAIQDAVTAVSAAIEPGGVPATKAAAGLAGLDGGFPRAPLRVPDQEAAAAIEAAVRKLRQDFETVRG